jgi:hypothetical protein
MTSDEGPFRSFVLFLSIPLINLHQMNKLRNSKEARKTKKTQNSKWRQ